MSTERRIERPGSETVYDVVGSGPPVLLGHSLLCDRTMWSGVSERLSDDFTLININLRGHGSSTASAPFSIWDLAADWVAIMDAENIERAALCGLSTGGMTAMRLAVRHPERVAGLALLDTDAGRESAFNRAQYAALGAVYRHTGFIPVGVIAKKFFCAKTARERPEVLDELIALIRTFDRREAAFAMKAVFGRDAVDVSPIEAPTLVMVGEHDAATTPSRSRHLAKTISGARLEVIADAGHLTAIEQPEVVATHLRPFLASCFE